MTIYGRSEKLVSRCVECDLAEPESLAALGGSAPGLVDGILSDDDITSEANTDVGTTNPSNRSNKALQDEIDYEVPGD